MSYIEQFKKDAIQGGWLPEEEPCHHKLMHDENGCPFGFHYPSVEKMLLDPRAFQAVGRTRGWGDQWATHENNPHYGGWHQNMHRFIDHRADGDSIEEALGKL